MSSSRSALIECLNQAQATCDPVFCAWCMMPSALVAEGVARGPFPAVLVDMQHGGAGYGAAQDMVSAITLAGTSALVRIPVDDFALASRALDFGAQAIVAPMINSAEQARALVNAVKYPPLGERSFGPFRACQLFEIQDANDYVREGNRTCLAFAMIETKEALNNLEAILEVEGIDGVFVGPADLSLTLLSGARFDLEDEAANHAYKMIAKKARETGKFAAIYAPNTDYAKRFADYGYQLITVGTDTGYLAAGMQGFADALGVD